jgi:hypothetical protein
MEEKIKNFRKNLIEKLSEEKITFYEWEKIRNYIDQKYEGTKMKSTL